MATMLILSIGFFYPSLLPWCNPPKSIWLMMSASQAVLVEVVVTGRWFLVSESFNCFWGHVSSISSSSSDSLCDLKQVTQTSLKSWWISIIFKLFHLSISKFRWMNINSQYSGDLSQSWIYLNSISCFILIIPACFIFYFTIDPCFKSIPVICESPINECYCKPNTVWKTLSAGLSSYCDPVSELLSCPGCWWANKAYRTFNKQT